MATKFYLPRIRYKPAMTSRGQGGASSSFSWVGGDQAASHQRRKRQREGEVRRLKNGYGVEDEQDDDPSLCWFCQEARAVLRVQLPHPRFPKSSTKKITRCLCLLHYYTTPAARMTTDVTSTREATAAIAVSSTNSRLLPQVHHRRWPQPEQQVGNNKVLVEVLDEEEMELKLKPMQELFAEAFVQLQQELSEEAAIAYTAQQHDPLAILHNLNKKQPRRTAGVLKKQKPPLPKTTTESNSGGGFLRDVPLPERIVRTREKQAQVQRDMEHRMERAAAVTTTTMTPAETETQNSSRFITTLRQPPAAAAPERDYSKRRKASRKTIWNTILESNASSNNPKCADGNRLFDKNNESSTTAVPELTAADALASTTTCTCGSNQVHILGTNASRNQDLKKGETWGMKDRGDEVIDHLQCQSCGRTWSEEA